MQRLSLPALLREGAWGGLRPGVLRQDVVRALGMPTSWQPADAARIPAGPPIAGWVFSEVLRYGAIEFFFPPEPAGRCWLIFCDDLEAVPERGWLGEGLGLAAVAAQLQGMGLRWRQEVFAQNAQQIRLILPSGARLGLTSDPDFFEHPGEGQRLFCVEVTEP